MSAGEIGDRFEQIMFLDAEDVIGAEFFREFETALVGGQVAYEAPGL